MHTAVIGIGSNSVRMLTADMEGKTAVRTGRDREGTRLFAGLDEQGNLRSDSMESTLAAVTAMYEKARQQGCREISIFATSAVRDAKNQQRFSDMIKEKTGCPLDICTGDNEAALSFFGATSGDYEGVIDIGGGSTEYVVGQADQIRCSFSLQMGAVRLFQKYPLRCAADVDTVKAAALALLNRRAGELEQAGLPKRWVGVGGTFTTLAAMVNKVPWTERTYMHGTIITCESTQMLALQLADMPMAERLKLPGLQPHRADIVVHGICILLASMERLGIERMMVSEYGNLDGYMKKKYGIMFDC